MTKQEILNTVNDWENPCTYDLYDALNDLRKVLNPTDLDYLKEYDYLPCIETNDRLNGYSNEQEKEIESILDKFFLSEYKFSLLKNKHSTNLDIFSNVYEQLNDTWGLFDKCVIFNLEFMNTDQEITITLSEIACHFSKVDYKALLPYMFEILEISRDVEFSIPQVKFLAMLEVISRSFDNELNEYACLYLNQTCNLQEIVYNPIKVELIENICDESDACEYILTKYYDFSENAVDFLLNSWAVDFDKLYSELQESFDLCEVTDWGLVLEDCLRIG